MAMQEWGPIKEDRQNLYWCLTQTLTASNFLQTGEQWEDDFLLLSDVFPTAFHATELACVSAGKTVAIFGAGPVDCCPPTVPY